MNPKKILAFLLLISILILGITLTFPEKGIVISKDFTLNLHWSFNQLQNKDTIKHADISKIIDINKQIIKTNISKGKTIKKEIKTQKTAKSNIKLLKENTYCIEYPSGNTNILTPFFKKINNANKKRVRILHYGDSQIEGDRITGYLRNKLQEKFGGSGPGIMPAVPTKAESASIIHKISNNWTTYSSYYKKDSTINNKKFGIIGQFSKYTQKNNAWIEFKHSGMAFPSVNKFTHCRIFYESNNSNEIVKGYLDDKLIWFEEFSKTTKTRTIDWKFNKYPKKLKIVFEGGFSPNIYGISLDASTGIAVDNISFRGSSGTDFSKTNFNQMKEMASFLNTGLIIFEFGVNVVPYQTNSYAFYERALIREIKFLKKAFNNTPILIVGVSDMSQHKGTHYISYPNIEKILKAQRMAAKKTDCAFWDLYHAMGGQNSMPEWVFAKPPLARKDFTHFNRRGSYIVAQMLFNALMKEYNNYN